MKVFIGRLKYYAIKLVIVANIDKKFALISLIATSRKNTRKNSLLLHAETLSDSSDNCFFCKQILEVRQQKSHF